MPSPKPALTVDALGARARLAGLLRCVASSRSRTGDLLRRQQAVFRRASTTSRLALEVAVIQTYAERLVGLLRRRDPLSERVHLGKAGVAGFGLLGLLWGATRRVGRVFAAGHKPQDA